MREEVDKSRNSLKSMASCQQPYPSMLKKPTTGREKTKNKGSSIIFLVLKIETGIGLSVSSIFYFFFRIDEVKNIYIYFLQHQRMMFLNTDRTHSLVLMNRR